MGVAERIGSTQSAFHSYMPCFGLALSLLYAVSVLMAETVPAKADVPAPVPPDLVAAAFPSATPAALPAAKKKAACRPQKGTAAAVAEQILEAVAATKERQAPKLGAMKKTISAAGYQADKGNARPNQSGSALAHKGAPAEGGASATALHPDRDPEPKGAESELGEAMYRSKRGAKRKAPARKAGPKRAAAAKPAAQKRAKKAAAKSPRKRTVAKRVSKRPPVSSPRGRQRRAARRK